MADRSQLFSDIDSLEPERFTAHLAEDVTMRFGNAEPSTAATPSTTCGPASARGSTGFASETPALGVRGGTSWEADVTYTRKDGGTVTVPVVTIYREGDGGIVDYRIFIDLAPLFA